MPMNAAEVTSSSSQGAAGHRPLVTVMTRLRTVNVGNEALSSELLRATAAAFPGHRVQPLERAPRFLARYSTSQLPRDVGKALTLFESWASRLERLGRQAPLPDPGPQAESPVRLALDVAAAPWRGRLKEKLQLRRYAARLGVYDREFISRLSLHRHAELALVNPAGELNPQSIDPPLRMFLELRAAQRLGARAGIVNFSFEIPDPFLTEFFGAVLAGFDFVSVRDHRSRAVLAAAGVPEPRLAVIGDLAFLTSPSDTQKGAELAQRLGIGAGTIVLVINGKFGHGTVDDWRRVVEQLAPLATEVVMLSNELSSDLPFARKLQRVAPVRVIEEQFSYRDYAALLRHPRMVVSNRLHTAVLALVVGTPVVAIELIARRIKGVMEEVGYPIPVPLMTEPDWIAGTVAATHRVLTDEASLRARIPGLIGARRALIADHMHALLRGTHAPEF